jgi:two-component system, cell cycle sensor histidine kinase and response regulator CckA
MSNSLLKSTLVSSANKQSDINVLLIEDNLAEARLLQELLKDSLSNHFVVTHVTRLAAAITQLPDARFDVALLDLTLPDSDGLASLAPLIHQAPSLPIVVLTGINNDDVAVDAVRRGAQDYLVKRQVNLDVLVRSIRYAIERKQLAQALQEINETLERRIEERTSAVESVNESLSQEIESRESIQNRLELAQQAGKIGTFEWNAQLNKFTWSKELEALYGLLPGSFGDSQSQWLATIHAEDRPLVRIEIQRWHHLSAGAAMPLGQELDLQFRIVHPDTSIHWIAVQCTMFPDHNGNSTRMIGIHMDITENKQLEAQFLRAQRLESLGTLASGIAHDLNNVLTPILAVAQLLSLKLTNIDGHTKTMLEILESSARRGADLIKQILSFAQGIEGKHVIIQPHHLLVDIQKILQQTLPKSIEIDIDMPADLWTVLGDMTQLHQVLMNLCVNARDAMPNGGKISITAINRSIDAAAARFHLDAHAANYVEIVVSDTGAGIQPQLLHRIFDPFFTTKEIGKGTGLGLSAVLGIIKSHDGFLDVQSQVHQGTQFHVYLPASNNVNQPVLNQPELPHGHQQLILVVDDEIAISKLIQTILEAYNYRVLTANGGAEAIAIYNDQRDSIDGVVIDLMMPIMDGLTTANALYRFTPSLPVLAMSGLNSVESINHAKRLGCHHFLSKPFTTNELLQKLQDCLSSKSLRTV